MASLNKAHVTCSNVTEERRPDTLWEATAKGEMGNSQKVLVDAQNVLKNMKSDCTQKD